MTRLAKSGNREIRLVLILWIRASPGRRLPEKGHGALALTQAKRILWLIRIWRSLRN